MRARWDPWMNSTCKVSRARCSSRPGAGSPKVAASSITCAMPRPCVARLSSSARMRPWLSSFCTSAPMVRMTSPSRLSATISRPRREPGSRQRGSSSRGGAAASGLAVTVTDAIERFDRVELRVHLAEFAPHALDVAVDGAVVDVNLIVVSGVHQVIPALHETRALRQRLQQQKFGDRQLDRLAVPQAVVPRRVQREASAADRLAWRGRRCAGIAIGRAGAPQNGLHPLDEQTLAERLVDVVVGAEVEAQDLVDLLVLRSEDDHRKLRGLPQAPQHLHAVHARHLYVQDGEIGGVALKRSQASGAVEVALNLVAQTFEGEGHRGHDVLVVVDQRDLRHFRAPCLRMPRTKASDWAEVEQRRGGETVTRSCLNPLLRLIAEGSGRRGKAWIATKFTSRSSPDASTVRPGRSSSPPRIAPAPSPRRRRCWPRAGRSP